MAESILRLKVSSEEYDNKLKQATNGLTRYVDECRKVGGTLEVVEKETLDYVRALGQMDTTSRTATGKLAEMKKTFTELSVVYKNMTDEEKNSPFGKALATSLDQLKGRIQDSKSQLDDINKSVNGGGGLTGALDSLSDKFGMSVQSLAGWGTALAAGKAALDVAKDAFSSNEEMLDEWGHVVESSHSLYQGFLNALNTGDISGFLSNIDQIVKAARDAYDALDELGTYNAFNQINVERTRTNMTESIADYRGGQGSKEIVKAAGEAYKKELQDRKRLENEAYLAAVKRVAAERGVSARDLTDALSGTYGHYQDLKNVQPTGVRQTVVGAGMFARAGTETFAQTRQEKLGEALRHLTDTELQNLQALGAQAQRTGNEIAQVDKQLTRVLNGRQAGGVGGSSSGRSSSSGGATGGFDLSKIAFDPNKAMLAAVKAPDIEGGSEAWNTMREAITGCKEGLIDFSAETANWDKKFDPVIKMQEKMAKAAQQQQMAFSLGAEAANNLGAAFAGMEDPAAKAAGTVISAIANIALGFAMASIQAEALGPIGWIAWLAAGTAALATTISTVHSLTGYAQGGIVKGNSYSGDNIYGGPDAMVNAGELVLTKAQQGNLASQLQEGGMRNMNLSGRIRGTDIILSVDRTLSLEGKQLLTWGR